MKNLRKLYFAISFSNPVNVPKTLKWIQADNSVRFKGIEDPGFSAKKISLENIFSELEKEGLFIQSGFAQKRTGENKMFFTAVKFEFGEERINPVQEEMLKQAFLNIFQMAFWNIKVFCHENDVTVACSGRQPRYEGNDRLRPVKIWDKDPVTKERIGNQPLLIEPDGVLSFSDGSLVLSKYE